MSLLNEILSKAKQVGGKVIDYLDGDNTPAPVAPVTPVKKVSILEEIRNTPAVQNRYDPVPRDKYRETKETGPKVPAHLQGLRAEEYEQSVVKSILNQPSISVGPVAPAYIPYKKNPTEEDEIEEFVTLQKKFNERFSTEKGDKLNKETNIGVLLDTIKGQYSFTDDEALAVVLKTVPLGQLPESLNIDERVKNQYLSQYLPKNWEKVDKDYNSRGEVYKKYQTSLKAYDSALFTDKELDEIKKNDNSFSQFKKDLLLNLGQGIATDFAGGLASIGGYLGNKAGIDTPYLDKVSADAQTVGAMAQEKKSALQQYKEMKPFEWDDLGDSSTYIKISRALPNLVAFAGVAGLVGKGAMVSARLLGLGKTAQVATAVVTSGFVNRGFESLQEAGGVFSELRGELGDEKADDAADEIFTKNMALVGNDIIQFGTNFFPGKTALTKVLGVAFDMSTEGGEEFLQGYIQYAATEKAYGRAPMSMGDWSKTSAAKEAVAGGLVLGGISQGAILGAGGTQNYFKNKKFTAALGKISLHAGASGIEGFDAEIDALLKKGTINQGQADGMKEIYNQALKANFDAIRENKQETVSESIDKAIPSTIVENAPAVNPNTKPKNIARIENEYRNASPETRTNIIVRALKSFGYKVKRNKSTKSDSEYLTVSHKGVEGGVETTIRLSDHKLPQKYSSKQKKKDFEIDKYLADPFPFNDVISKMNGENVKQGNFEKYKASADVQKFERAMKNMENEEIADYMSGSDQAVYDAGGLELTSRGVSADELTAYLENATPKKYERPRKSIMDEVREGATIDMTGATDENLRAKSFGFTYDPQGGALYQSGGKTDGIVVTPFPNRSGFIPGTMDEISFGVEFEIYVQKNMDLIKQGLKAGGWYSESRGGLVFDVGIVLPTEFRAFAEKLGKDTNQEGIFNLFDTNEDTAYIPTGGDGKTPQNFDENAILDIIRPYISKQPSYDTISPTNGISGPIENGQGTNSGNLTTDVSTDNGGSTTAEVALNPDDFKLSKGLSKGTPRYKTFTIDFRNDLNRALYIIRDSRGARSASDDLYLQEVMDFTGLSEQEARTLGDTVNNNLKKNEKNAINGVITLDDNLINLSTQGTKVAIDALPETLPFTGEQTIPKADKLLEAGDIDGLIAEFGAGGTFIATSSISIDNLGFIEAIDPKTYKERTGKTLNEGQTAYQLKTPLTPDSSTSYSLSRKTGLGSKGNFFKGAGWAITGYAAGDLIAPFLTMNTFITDRILNFLGAQHVLSTIIDKDTGRTAAEILSANVQKRISDAGYLADKGNLYTKLTPVLDGTLDVSSAFDKLSAELDTILEGETKNTLNNQSLTDADKADLKSTILGVAFDGKTLFGSNGRLNEQEKIRMGYLMAIDTLYHYYPAEVRTIVGDEIADFTYSQITDRTNSQSAVYTEGGNALEQMGEKVFNVGQGKYSPGFNVDKNATFISPEDRQYQRYTVLFNTYKYRINNGEEIANDEGFADTQAYIDYLKLQKALEKDSAKEENINREIKRIEDSITKEKGQDNLDVFRVKSPWAQELIYASHVANVAFQQSTIGLLKEVQKVAPKSLKSGAIGFKGFGVETVGLMEDIFVPDARNRTLSDINKLESIYGAKISKADTAKGASISMFEGASTVAAFGIAKLTSVGRAVVTLLHYYNDPRILSTQYLKEGSSVEFNEFLLENGLERTLEVTNRTKETGYKDRHFGRALAQVELQKKFNTAYGSKAGAFIKGIGSNISIGMRGVSNVLFGNTIEAAIAKTAGLLSIQDSMEAETGKKYKGNTKQLIADFNELSKQKQQDIREIAGMKMRRNYDTQLATKSSVRMLRSPRMNFLVNYARKMVAANMLRHIDVRSIELALSPEGDTRFKSRKAEQQKTLIYRNTVATALFVSVAALRIALDADDDDDKDDKYGSARYFRSILFARNWLLSAGIDMDSSLIRMFASISTPVGFTKDFTTNLWDLSYAGATGDDARASIIWKKLITQMGLVGQLVDLGFMRDKDRINLSANGQVTYLSGAGSWAWAMENLVPGNVPYNTQKASERTLLMEKADGFIGPFSEFLNETLYKQKVDTVDQSLNNTFSLFTSSGRDQKSQVSSGVDKMNLFNDVVEENPNMNFSEAFNEYLRLNGAKWIDIGSGEVNVMKALQKMIKSDETRNKVINNFFNGKVGGNLGFAFSPTEKAGTTWNNIMSKPEVFLAFTNYMVQISDIKWDEDIKKTQVDFKKARDEALQAPNSKNYIAEVAAKFTESLRYDNTIARTVTYELDALSKIENPTAGDYEGAMGRMEMMLGIAKNDHTMSAQVKQSIQSVIAKKGTKFADALIKENLIRNTDYPLFLEAMVQITEDSTLSLKDYRKAEATNVDMEVASKLIEKNGGKMPAVSPQMPADVEFEPGVEIKAPSAGMIGVEENGAVYIKDYLGRHIAFTPFRTTLKEGDAVNKGDVMGTSKRTVRTSKFDAQKVPAKQPDSPIVETDATMNYGDNYFAVNGNIDFYALADSIKAKGTKKKKTSPKKSKSILEEVISLQPKKSNLSIMQEIISKQTTK